MRRATDGKYLLIAGQRRFLACARKYLSEVQKTGRVAIQTGSVRTELYKMASNKSMRSSLNHQLVWRYRAIGNPYISGTHATSVSEENNPLIEMPNVQPLPPEYGDEVYLSNRILAFERDGWKCTKCDSRENLQAHHIQSVPKGTFNPMVVHRADNLQTLCLPCHAALRKKNAAQHSKL
jgi:hypothetical protein